jgi:hypothetical protein
MSPVDHFKYEALFLEDHSASVDWRERRKSVMADAFLAASINLKYHTKLSLDVGPFILNSGTTIYISPDALDFFELRAIPPWTIKSIGGSSINATGLGKICLHLAKGHTIILDPALYVPEAAVWLMSVVVLGEGPQQLISHFDGN